MDFPRVKDISLTQELSVTLPAHIWLGFYAAYMNAEWSCSYAAAVAVGAREQFTDPLWLKEQEARHQQAHDVGKAFFHRIVTGEFPEPPPNMTDDPPREG